MIRDLLDPDPGGKKAEIKYVPDEKAQLEEQELNKQYKTFYCWCLIIEICQTFVKDLLEIFLNFFLVYFFILWVWIRIQMERDSDLNPEHMRIRNNALETDWHFFIG